jgi:hypothetical protein
MTNATKHDYAAQARQAIEIVCSGDVSRMEEFYSPDFVDHVNGCWMRSSRLVGRGLLRKTL